MTLSGYHVSSNENNRHEKSKECISAVHDISFLRITSALLWSFMANGRTRFFLFFPNLHIGNTFAEQEPLYLENDM